MRLGESLLSIGASNACFEELTPLALRSPESPAVHVVLGRAAKDVRQYEVALQEFRRALQLAPTELDAAEQLSGILSSILKRPKEAIEVYLQIENQNQNSPLFYLQLARCAFDGSDFSTASRAFGRFFEFRPDLQGMPPISWQSKVASRRAG